MRKSLCPDRKIIFWYQEPRPWSHWTASFRVRSNTCHPCSSRCSLLVNLLGEYGGWTILVPRWCNAELSSLQGAICKIWYNVFTDTTLFNYSRKEFSTAYTETNAICQTWMQRPKMTSHVLTRIEIFAPSSRFDHLDLIVMRYCCLTILDRFSCWLEVALWRDYSWQNIG